MAVPSGPCATQLSRERGIRSDASTELSLITARDTTSMHTTADLATYIAQFAAASVYAAVLELGLKRQYEPDHTWVTVVGGTAQTGLIVAARLALAPLPHLAGTDLAWWAWWLWAWSFVAGGLPIIVWQIVIQKRRWKAVQAAWERWIVHEG